MEWLQGNWDSVIGTLGFVLSIYNLWNSRLRFEVRFQPIGSEGYPQVSIVNHSKFDAYVTEIGFLNNKGETTPLWYLEPELYEQCSSLLVKSMGDKSIQLNFQPLAFHKLNLHRAYVISSTGKLYKSKHTQGAIKGLCYRAVGLLEKIRTKLKPSTFAKI